MSINVINQRVLIKQIQNDVSKILNGYLSENDSKDVREDMVSKVCDVFINRIPETFDKDKFQVKIDINNGALDITPSNFVSALWLQGIMVSDTDISGNTYETSVAIYQWEDDKLVIVPKARVDLI